MDHIKQPITDIRKIMTTFCIDIDGTICSLTSGNYLDAEPFESRIAYLNSLRDEGHRVILFTARGSTTGVDWRDSTTRQLMGWGLSYDSLLLGKPYFDVVVDDKSVLPEFFFPS